MTSGRKRLVVISDTHCGSRAGLTPPEWQFPKGHDHDREKFRREQQIMWDWYVSCAQCLAPVDILVCNGDMIDGKGDKSGGTEQLTTDRRQQVAMAAECIAAMKPRNVVLIYGTAYHTGADEDWEAVLGDRIKVLKIGGHEWVKVAGVMFDFKHKTSRSVIPHGRLTGPMRAALWNALWAERGIEPRADVIIRSHAHFFVHGGDGHRLVMITPCLQGFGTKYGVRECEGFVDIGLVSFDCEGGKYSWQAHLLDLIPFAPQPIRL